MKPLWLVVMGVSGSGKTSLGRALAERLVWDFYDADDFHPKSNIAKMAAGTPLTDADRAPWLAALHELIAAQLAAGQMGVLACSALKEAYRRLLWAGDERLRYIHLRGSFELIQARMATRPGHYMRPGMLRSQFETLEEPSDALTLDVNLPVEELVERLVVEFGLENG
jgi:gluconokinase